LTRSSNTSDKTQRTTEADDNIGSHLRQEQHYDHLTPLTKLKKQQKPMTKIGPHLRQEQQYDPLTPLANFTEQQKPMTK
jgi:hypothetical protein